MRSDKKTPLKSDKKAALRGRKRGVAGYSKKSALLEDAITQMNAGKYGRSSAVLKELLALDPHNMEARRLFATLHLRLGSLIPARQAFDSLIDEAFERQDYWLAESLLREYLVAGPRCVPYLERLGTIYQDKGNMLDAVTEYGKIVDILIEDPEPENPHRASQLYAKIKDLAPTSAITFRLAAFFDPQTGELVARSPAVPGEEGVGAPSSSLVSDTSSGSPATIEPMTGMKPWEQVEDSPVTSPLSLMQEPAQPLQFPVSPSVVTETPQEERSFRISEPVEAFPMEKIPGAVQGDFDREDSLLTVSSSDFIGEVSAALPEFDSTSTRSDEKAAPPTPSSQTPGSPSMQIQQEGVSEAMPAPMPWEDVQESSIPIPDYVPDALPSPSAQAEVPSLPDLEPAAPIPDQASAGPSEEMVEGGVFSWNSLLTSPWKFGENPLTSALKPEAGEDKIITTEETSASASVSIQLLPSSEESIEIPEADPAQSPSDSPPSSEVVAPMPWDQVQESVIAIPAVEGEETAAEPPTEVVTQLPSHVEPILTLRQEPVPEVASPQPIIPSASTVPEAEPFSGQPPSTSSSSEPDFVLADNAPAKLIEEKHASGEAMEQSSSEFPLVSEPLESVGTAPPPSLTTNSSTPAVDMVSTEALSENISPQQEHEQVDSAGVPETIVPNPSGEPGQVPSLPTGEQLPWKVGETEDECRRSPSKKWKKTSEPVSEVSVSPSSSGETIRLLGEQGEDQQSAFRETDGHVSEPVSQQEEWVKTGQSIQFRDESQKFRAEAPVPPPLAPTGESRPISTAAAAVDVLFDSSGRLSQTRTGKRITQAKPGPSRRSRLHRSRIAISSLVTSWFSTTQSIVRTLVALVVLTGALVTLGIGAVGLLWIIMEDRPSPAFQSLTTSPPRMLSDSRKNGYLLLLGFDAPAGEDPLQAGYERKLGTKDAAMALACLADYGSGKSSFGQPKASANVAAGWFRETDPVGQFKSHQPTIRGWVSQGESALSRYRQWQKLPFEDWGYGQTISPPCTSILFAHRLYLADGFIQKGNVGVNRLEADMEAWRTVLGQARTLPMKTLALQAINDNIVVASGLLVRRDFGSEYLGRVTKMLRPLDQVELSMRWPMQSELVSASKHFDSQLKAEKGFPAGVAASLPLPKQRRFNSYATYYEASYKAAGEGRYSSLPKWRNYIQFPASTIMDYLTNPIENVVGVEPLAPWDLYNGLVVDTDAHLRLASLQAWLRRGPQDADLLTRIAKAGQRFYDPYTGLPMLVNLKKGVMYSVGHDGKDQDADPQFDVVVMIPANWAPASTRTSSAGSSRSK